MVSDLLAFANLNVHSKIRALRRARRPAAYCVPLFEGALAMAALILSHRQVYAERCRCQKLNGPKQMLFVSIELHVKRTWVGNHM